ncbi:hypothetical protein VE03_03603 [Pseudogymnoascus sp. 23342-1-I1]|nr:hypothetical protein VE03_03603 [Pseudogymnoascus sp. 23342-1-I1]
MDSDSIAAAAEAAKPNLGSNDREAPPADDGQDKPPTHSPQPEATLKANNNEQTQENTSQSDTVSAGQSVIAVEGPGPSHDSKSGDAAPSAAGGQQELDTHIHQPDAADAALVTTYDGATEETSTQSVSPSRDQNVTGTESARHSPSAAPDVDFDVVEEGTHIENMPINNGSPSQLERSLPSQSDARLGKERNLESDPEPGPEPAPELVLESNLEPHQASNPESEETRDTYTVCLAQMSSINMEPSEVKLNQDLGQAIVDGDLEKFKSLLGQGADIKSRFDDEEDDGDLNQSTLFLAARHDRPKIAEKILEHKLAKDFLEDNKTNGWTPAHISARNNNIDVLRHILEAGDTIGIKQDIVDSMNRDNDTPLLLAAREGCLEVVKTLLDNRANLKIKSINRETPLHSAAYHGFKEVFEALLGVTGAKDLIGEPDEEGWTVLHCAAFGGIEVNSRDYDKSILELLTKRTQATPLHIAAVNGHNGIVMSFLAAGSNILAKTNNGKTVFHMAAESGNVDILKELAGRLDPDTLILRDHKGGTALYSAAVQEEYKAVFFLMEHSAFALPRLELGASAKVNYHDAQEVEKFLLNFLKNPEKEPDSLAHWHLIVHWAVFYWWESIAKTCFDREGDLCNSKTKSGETLLHVAACNGHAGVVGQLMDCFKERKSRKINVMAKVSGKKNDKIIPLHFAAGNGHLKIMRCLLESSISDQFVAESQNGEAVLHLDSWDQIVAESGNGETALYFAARNGHEKVVSAILVWLDTYPKLQNTIRKKTSDGKTPLSQATENGHQGVAKALLEVLTKHDFNNDPKVAWDELTEVARTGLEHYVELIITKNILQPSILGTKAKDLFPDQKWTGLLWAVYYGHYEAVWWLLRRSGPPILTSKIMRDSTNIINVLSQKLTNTMDPRLELRYTAIRDCLDDPPRVENVYDRFDPDGSPSVPQLSSKKKMVCDKYKATIVDFYDKADHVSFATLNRTITSTIYDENQSLDDIMTGAGMNRTEPKSLSATGTAVSQASFEGAAPETPAAGTQRSAVTTRQEESSKQKQVRDDKYRLRWIHVPANNMEWIERQLLKADPQRNIGSKIDQTTRGSEGATKLGTNTVPNTEQGKSLTEKESRTEIDRVSSGAEHIALYMPYLTFSKANVGGKKSVQGHDTSLVAEYRRGIIHELRTLDRYYYSSLPEKDVETRDKDQVLTKYIKSKKEDKKFSEPRSTLAMDQLAVDQQHEKRKGQLTKPTDRQHNKLEGGQQKGPKKNDAKPEKDQHKGPNKNDTNLEVNQHKRTKKNDTDLILQVDQLWLWVIDNDKIITSSSYQGDEELDTIVKSVVRHLMEGRDLDRHPPSSPEQLMKLIVSSATGTIEQQKEIVPEKGLSLSVLEIFENAIGDIKDGQLNLFSEFKKTLGFKDTLNGDYSTNEDDSANEDDSISEDYSIGKEIHYLVSIKDVLDELNILKSLIKDQKKVWHDAFSEYRMETKSLANDQKKQWHDALSKHMMAKDYLNSREPGEILETLEEMITDATRVERSINDLLDLKQKQANLSEAQSARKQADATASQGTTLMVFTIVTIVFLPMSFLAALFALDITVFPHATDKLSYTPGWIFPMIFGPSAAMSIPAIYLAFHVDTVINIWNKLKSPAPETEEKQEKKQEKKHDDVEHSEPPLKYQATVSKNDSELEKCVPNGQPSNGIMRRLRRVRVFK